MVKYTKYHELAMKKPTKNTNWRYRYESLTFRSRKEGEISGLFMLIGEYLDFPLIRNISLLQMLHSLCFVKLPCQMPLLKKNSIADYSEEESYRLLRIHKEDFLLLLYCLGLDGDAKVVTSHRETFSGHQALLLFIHRMTTGIDFLSLAPIFGRDSASLCRTFALVLEYIYKSYAKPMLSKGLEKMAPSFEKFSEAFHAKLYNISQGELCFGPPGSCAVAGFTDCVIFSTCRLGKAADPDGNERIPKEVINSWYNKYKNKYGEKYLTVVGMDGMVLYMSNRFKCRRHDQHVYDSCGFERKWKRAIQGLNKDYVVLSDKGFAMCDICVPLFKKPRNLPFTPFQKLFNRNMAVVFIFFILSSYNFIFILIFIAKGQC